MISHSWQSIVNYCQIYGLLLGQQCQNRHNQVDIVDIGTEGHAVIVDKP